MLLRVQASTVRVVMDSAESDGVAWKQTKASVAIRGRKSGSVENVPSYLRRSEKRVDLQSFECSKVAFENDTVMVYDQQSRLKHDTRSWLSIIKYFTKTISVTRREGPCTVEGPLGNLSFRH